MIGIDLEPLVDLLGNNDPAVRIGAAVALARSGDPRGMPVLLEGLADASSRVRVQCALALGEWYDLRSEHIIRLAEGLFDSTYEVQIAAIAALRRMRRDVVLKAAEHLLREASGEDALRKQRLVARMVGLAALPDGVDVLCEVAHAVRGHDREAWGDVVWALGQIDSDEARSWLLELAREHIRGTITDVGHLVTLQFIRALARQGTPEALTTLATWAVNSPELIPAIARFVTPSPFDAFGHLVQMQPFELFEDLLGTEPLNVRQGSRVITFIPAGDNRHVVIIEEGAPDRHYQPDKILLLDPARVKDLREDERVEAERLLGMVEPAWRVHQALKEQGRLGYEVEIMFDDRGNIVGAAYSEHEITAGETLDLMEHLFGYRKYDLMPVE